MEWLFTMLAAVWAIPLVSGIVKIGGGALLLWIVGSVIFGLMYDRSLQRAADPERKKRGY